MNAVTVEGFLEVKIKEEGDETASSESSHPVIYVKEEPLMKVEEIKEEALEREDEGLQKDLKHGGQFIFFY